MSTPSRSRRGRRASRSGETTQIRQASTALGALLSSIGFTAGRASETFAFEPFERRLSSETDVDGAERALAPHLPLGTGLNSYPVFFHALGGSCVEVADTRRFPNTMLCVHAHGRIVRAEWRLVVHFDPATRTSVDQTLNYGLTGP